MSEKRIDTKLLDDAITFAVKAHSGYERRGKGYPYIVHPMEAASIVAEITSDQELLSAAVLHDVIEDADVSVEEIKERFGTRIAELVSSETDLVVKGKNESDSWIERKKYAIDRLKGLSRDAKIVTLGDKLSNARAMLHDYKEIGENLWNKFHVSDPKLHKWHYEGLRDALSELKGTGPYDEFSEIVDRLFSKY